MATAIAGSLASPAVVSQIAAVQSNNSFTRVSVSEFRGRSSSLTISRRQRLISCQAQGDAAPAGSSPAVERKSILCSDCNGNGAVACSQCKGDGVNLEDHFQGRFKAGQTCWLCRGKRQMLCGNCNGAGFVGGFLSSSDD